MQKMMKQKFSLFYVFLEISFWATKKSFPPFSPKRLDRSGWNFFYVYFSQIGVRVFFFASKYCSYKIWRSLENSNDKKKRVFDRVFSILLLLTYLFGIFQKKKPAPRFGPSHHKEIFSSKKWSLDFCQGENFWSF